MRKAVALAALLSVPDAWLTTPCPAAEVFITEFMAANTETLDDEDGDYADWIELHNAGAAPVDLDGWYLTDDAVHLEKWRW